MNFVFFLFCFSVFGRSISIIVPTQYGPIEGSIKTTEAGTDYYNFQRIPFASPPLGALKFRDPIPPTQWTEPLNCTVEGPAFWGTNEVTGELQGDFDALHLSVYTKEVNPPVKYPVMVFIHGGGYSGGSYSTQYYGPDYLLEKDVIVVATNYRLGVYGFLSLNDPELNVPGNQAFKDQRMALKWIQDNIENFGGDPTKVTLFGQSAGGGSVHSHLVSESSRGLFQRAIVMAGTALYTVRRTNWPQLLVERMGFNAATDSEILTFLENANPADVIATVRSFSSFEAAMTGNSIIAFGPTVEPYETGTAFLTQNVQDVISNAWSNDIDVMIGANSGEALSYILPRRHQPENLQVLSDFQNYIPRELNVTRDDEKSLEYAAIIKKTYYGLMEPSISNIDGIMAVYTDFRLWYSIQRIVKYRLQSQSIAKTFVYRFDAETENNLLRTLLPGVELYRQPMHGEELPHLFESIFTKPIVELEENTRNTIELMVSFFTNFAKYGEPSGELGLPGWPSVNAEALDSGAYLTGLNIQENSTQFGLLPEGVRTAVFENFFEIEESAAVLSSKVSLITILFALLLTYVFV